MRKVIKYTGEQTFMYPNGQLATPQKMEQDFPAIVAFTHIIETDENEQVCFAVQNLSATRSSMGIDSTLTEDKAIAAIQTALNTPVEPVVSDVPSPEERIASALEYQVMASMPDVEE